MSFLVALVWMWFMLVLVISAMWCLGDNGEVDFDTLTVPGTALVRRLTSTATGLGGVDEIVTGDGADYVIAGVGDDKVHTLPMVSGTGLW